MLDAFYKFEEKFHDEPNGQKTKPNSTRQENGSLNRAKLNCDVNTANKNYSLCSAECVVLVKMSSGSFFSSSLQLLREYYLDLDVKSMNFSLYLR